MKTIYTALARYNRSVNESVREILAGLSKEQLFMETKAFYHSIFDTCFHQLMSDFAWLKRYKEVFSDNKHLKESELLLREEKDFREEFNRNYKKIFETQKNIDVLIEQFIGDLKEENYASSFKYVNYKGVLMERILWQTLLHWFNHQTHHRGQISIFLDMMGITNDYSSLLTRI